MRKIVAILAIAISTLHGYAQKYPTLPFEHKTYQEDFMESQQLNGNHFISANLPYSFKTEVSDKRIIGYRRNFDSGSGIDFYDSLTYTYSGNRGSVNYQNNEFDQRIDYAKNVNIEPSSREIITWDANGLPTVRVSEVYNSGQWDVSYSRQYFYNANKELVQEVFKLANGGLLENYKKTEYTYNPTGTVAIIINSDWVSGAWVNKTKATFDYTADDKIAVYMRFNWVSGAWEADIRTITYYNSNSLMTQQIDQENIGGGVLQNVAQRLRTYDLSNNLETLTTQNWISGAWANSMRYVFTYDLANNELSQTQLTDSAGSWRNFARTFNTYTSFNKVLTHNSQSWISGAWVNLYRDTKSYNADNQLVLDSSEKYTSGVWENYYKYQYTYYSYGEVAAIEGDKWVSGAWVNNNQEYFYYEDYSASSVGSNRNELSARFFPNPTNSNIQVAFNSGNGRLIVNGLNVEAITSRSKFNRLFHFNFYFCYPQNKDNT
jgi:hypothetical protein